MNLEWHQVATQQIGPGGHHQFQWYPERPCELVDVRMTHPEGDIAIVLVYLGVDICAAFATRKRVLQPGQYVTVEARNMGRTGAQCGVEIGVREL